MCMDLHTSTHTFNTHTFNITLNAHTFFKSKIVIFMINNIQLMSCIFIKYRVWLIWRQTIQPQLPFPGYSECINTAFVPFCVYSSLLSFPGLNTGQWKGFRSNAGFQICSHKDQNDNISENQNKKFWDGKKISERFSTSVLYKILLWLGILKKDRFHIDDKNNKPGFSLITKFFAIQMCSVCNSSQLIFSSIFLSCWHMVIWILM